MSLIARFHRWRRRRDQVSDAWLRDQRRLETRNQYEGICWNWHALKPRKNLRMVRDPRRKVA